MGSTFGLRRVVAGVVCTCALLGAPSVAQAAAGDTTLLSRWAVFGPKGDNISFSPSASADGRYVSFTSDASNLSPDDTTPSRDKILVRDVVGRSLRLASRASGAAGAAANSDSRQSAISPDGRFVVYLSFATNLDPADPDGTADIYERDLVDNATTLVSRATGAAGAKGDDISFTPSVSANGRFVAFGSNASNLDPAHPVHTGAVYVRDLLLNTTTLVSRATGPAGADANGSAAEPSISGDGRRVAFSSTATNLDSDDADATTTYSSATCSRTPRRS